MNMQKQQDRHYIYDANTGRLFTIMAKSREEAIEKFVRWDMKSDPEAVQDVVNEATELGWDGYAQDSGLTIFAPGELEEVE